MLRLTTTLPRAERRRLRHPAEIPWLVAAVIITVLVAAAVISLLFSDIELPPDVQQIAVLIIGAPVLFLLVRGYLYAQQRASGVRLSPTQFPDAYRMLVEAAADAGMRRVPDAYVVSGSGVINAFAAGHGHRRFVVINSDMFEVGGHLRSPDALRFVIAHEVGHLAAGHAAYWRIVGTFIFRNIPVLGAALSRSQEYTADNYGYAHAPQGAPAAIATLAAGKYLNAEVLPDEYADRAVVDRSLFIVAVNLVASHPILTWRSHALRHRDHPGAMFVRPAFGVLAAPSLPPAASRTSRWADPAAALAFLDAHPQPGRDEFGGVQVRHRAQAARPTPVLDGSSRDALGAGRSDGSAGEVASRP